MTRRVEIHPSAAREARDARRWYAERDPEIAEVYVEELRWVLDAVATRPASFAPYFGGTRRASFRGFPYAVIFRDLGDAARVLAVMHERRRPDYWARRR